VKEEKGVGEKGWGRKSGDGKVGEISGGEGGRGCAVIKIPFKNSGPGPS